MTHNDNINKPVKCVFRKYPDGAIIALFPEIKEYSNRILSYMRVGQHGAADYLHVIATTKPARPLEYRVLELELTLGCGYKIKIQKRWIQK